MRHLIFGIALGCPGFECILPVTVGAQAIVYVTGPGNGALDMLGSVVADSTVVASSPSQEQVPGLKSGTTALLWSLLGTVVPAAASAPFVFQEFGLNDDGPVAATALVAALVVGPSLGHFYAARPNRAWKGIWIRTLAGAGVAAAAVAAVGSYEAAGSGESPIVIGVGLVTLAVGGAVLGWDIIRAPHSARVHNDEIRRGTTIGIIPSSDALGLGLRADVSF